MLCEAGFGGEIGVARFGALGVHDAGGGGAGLEDGEGAGGVEATVAGEFEALGKHGAMEPEDEIEDELHAVAGAGRAGVEELGADRAEDGEGAGGVEAAVAGEFEAFGPNGAMEPEDKGLTDGYLTPAGSPVVVSMSISTESARLVRTAATSAVTACLESRRTTPGG